MAAVCAGALLVIALTLIAACSLGSGPSEAEASGPVDTSIPATADEPAVTSTPREEWRKGEMPYLYQIDPQWADAEYCGGTFAEQGCGPTALTMVYVYLTGDTSYDPAQMAAFSTENGYATDGNGSAWTLMSEGAATLGLMDLGEHLDGALVDLMRRGGISRPRLVFAGIGAAGTLALYALEARRSAGQVEGEDSFSQESDEEDRELPAPARDLVALLLAEPEDGEDLPGAPALRAQLLLARTHGPAEEASEVWLTVPETAERAVPRHQTWPVRGTFTQQGHRFQLELQIDNGKLSMLSVFPDGAEQDPELDEAALEHLWRPDFSLPSAAEVEIMRETAAP